MKPVFETDQRGEEMVSLGRLRRHGRGGMFSEREQSAVDDPAADLFTNFAGRDVGGRLFGVVQPSSDSAQLDVGLASQHAGRPGVAGLEHGS